MLSIQNPRGVKYQDLQNIFDSKDLNLKEKISNGIISIFGEEDSNDFIKCLEKIFSGEKVTNINNVVNATLEYIFDYGDISEELTFKGGFVLDNSLENYFKKNFNSEKTLEEIFYSELPSDFFVKQIPGDYKMGIIFLKDLKKLKNILENQNLEDENENNIFNFFGLFSNKGKEKIFQKIFDGLKENIDFCIENEFDMIVFSY